MRWISFITAESIEQTFNLSTGRYLSLWSADREGDNTATGLIAAAAAVSRSALDAGSLKVCDALPWRRHQWWNIPLAVGTEHSSSLSLAHCSHMKSSHFGLFPRQIWLFGECMPRNCLRVLHDPHWDVPFYDLCCFCRAIPRRFESQCSCATCMGLWSK